MKLISLSLFITFCNCSSIAQNPSQPNIFIITTDGFRWQEIFNGADSAIINNPNYVKDTALLKQLYWDSNLVERRKLLLPFIWRTLAKNGSLYGNRQYHNKVSVANPYRFSYAGYNEIFTGYADPAIIANKKKWNKNQNVLEFLNEQPLYKNKVAAFTSWNLFDYILNKNVNNFYLDAGYNNIKLTSIFETDNFLQMFEDSVVNNVENTRNDMLTFIAAKEYIQNHHPKIVFIGFGGTDEYAHGGGYDGYLQSAHLFDEYLGQLWYLINNDSFYKNNSSIIITTDHGRGKKNNTWKRHDLFTAGSSNTWLITAGTHCLPKGEVKDSGEIFNEQIAHTIAKIVGFTFNPKDNTNTLPISFNK